MGLLRGFVMTIATLLEHVGVHVPRYVTVGGQVVLDGTTTVPSTAPAMPISPHRFHGGDDPAPSRSNGDDPAPSRSNGDDPAPSRSNYADAWWNVDDEARSFDEDQMRTYFPGFVQFTDGGDYAYAGVIDTGRGRFRILVMPHINRSLPSIIPMKKDLGRSAGGRFLRPPHLYTSGNLCIADVDDWEPARHSTATAAGWAAHWFAAFTEWRIIGRWPTEGFGAVA